MNLRFLLFFLIPAVIYSQLSIYGYFETEFDHFSASGKDYSFIYNKVRLDLESRPSERLLISGNLSGVYYSEDNPLNFLDFVPPQIWKPVLAPEHNPDSTHVTYIPFSFNDSLYIDNLYLRATFKYFDLTFGRQPVSLGSGYAWNPLDIFNTKDVLDPTYEQPHVTAVRVEFPVLENTTIDAIYAPENKARGEKSMFQIKSYLGGFDLTLNTARSRSLIPYWTVKDLNHTTWDTRFYGGSISGQVLGAGIWSEVNYSAPLNFELLEYVGGLDYTFTNGLYIFGEYYHNPLGSDGDDLDLTHYFNSYSGESHSLMQDYIMTIVNYPLNDFIIPSLMTVININDGSMLYAPQIVWEIMENMQLMLWYARSIGDDDTEFGIQNNMIRVRMKAYF